MVKPKISIRGAREHYLKNLNLDLPHHQLIVVTGVSGSGKSSLVVDTLYREGRRRYLEFLTGDFRPFLVDFPRSQVDSIEGLPPVFFVGSGSNRTSPRSTVGTLTEVQDFLRLLFSKAGEIFCHRCGRQLQRFTPHQIVEHILKFPQKTPLMILAPIPPKSSLSWLKKEGFVRVRVKGKLITLDQVTDLELKDAFIVVDRLTLERKDRSRLVDSTELALRYGAGVVHFSLPESKDITFCTDYRCVDCGINFGELAPGFFSFNNPYGACSKCHGMGWILEDSKVCPKCRGVRLREEVLSVRIGPHNIYEFGNLDIPSLLSFLGDLKFEDRMRQETSKETIQKIRDRLKFLADFGLSYLNLNRSADTLSAGEFQRVKLAAQMATGLVGVLYILDEPTVGLHPKEVGQLIKMLKELCYQGNTMVVVEHDSELIRAGDLIVELGPGAGPQGGSLIVQGALKKILSHPHSLTSALLNGRLSLKVSQKWTRTKPKSFITIHGARLHNLKNIEVKIPLGVFCCVTGVSGSGKSSLVKDILCKALQNNRSKSYDEISGLEKVNQLFLMDSRLGSKTVRSNVATLVGIFAQVRELFSLVPESRLRGYSESRFSFNLHGGRCEACLGEGIQQVEMYFLSDLEIPCEICEGTRYNPETLEVKYKGKNIAETLEMTVEEAALFLKNIPSITSRLKSLIDIGLGYLKLGQSSKSLSGGESQRIKLARHLSKRGRGHALYVFDEPTRGLHLADIEKFLNILFGLRDQGNSILIIEHHLEVIKCSDYVIDLGPGAGDQGGYLVAQGTPEEISKVESSDTGKYLKKLLLKSSVL